MANLTKRDLIRVIEDLPEDAQIRFVALHFMDEGDILDHVEPYDPEHAHLAEDYHIGVGQHDTIEEEKNMEVTQRLSPAHRTTDLTRHESTILTRTAPRG